MTIDFFGLIQLFAIGIGLFLIISILIRPTESRMAAYFLAGILFLLTINIFHDWSLSSGYALEVPHMVGLGPIHYYLIGPLIFAYIVSLIAPQRWGNWLLIIHFIPAMLYQFNRLPIYMQGVEGKLAVLNRYYSSSSETIPEISIQVFLQGSIPDFHWLAYIFASIWVIHLSKSKFKEKSRLVKLIRLLVVYMVLHLSLLVIMRFNLTSIENSVFITLRATIESLLMYGISFLSFNYSMKLDNSNLTPLAELSMEDQSLLNRIYQVVETDEHYKNNELSLKILANQLDINVQDISRVLNQCVGTGFKEYINTLRIKIACQKLDDGSYLTTSKTLERLGYDVGFNSKSTFYRAFKNQLGINPKQYLESRKNI